MDQFTAGDVLVADMTDPDWEPIMKRASAIVTNRGGRTCHAAIIARELGIPAVVGTGTATRVLNDGDPVTVSCAEGDTGLVYAGEVGFEVAETPLDAMPEIPTKIMMNVGTPEQAFAFSRLPHAGVGLARLEFIINRQIGIHPRALLDLEQLDPPLKAQIEERIVAYPSARDFFVQRVAEGISMIAAAFAPEPVIVRMSDFKSNEYANLLGGEALRAARGKPDARLPRGLSVPVGRLRRLLRHGMRSAAVRPRRDGPDQRQDHDPVRPDRRRRSRASCGCSASTGCAAGRTACPW